MGVFQGSAQVESTKFVDSRDNGFEIPATHSKPVSRAIDVLSTLGQKRHNARKQQQYRCVCLTNVTCRRVMKVLFG